MLNTDVPYAFKHLCIAGEFDEVLFIGDPHAKSTPIGKRKASYTAGVLDKLNQCKELSNSSNCLTIILGDLFHTNDENNLVLLNKLFKLFKSFNTPPLTLEGNHDVEGMFLDEEDALLLFKTANILTVISEPTIVSVQIKETSLALAFIPWGWDIPSAIPLPEGCLADTVIAVTHHDLAFGSSYPGSLPLAPIENVSMVVNGHIHDTKPAVSCGGTTYFNPGNIEPLSIDLMHHIPRVWRWQPSGGVSLTPFDLTYDPDMFDLKGYHVKAVDPEQAVAALATKGSLALKSSEPVGLVQSVFADQIEQAENSAPSRSHDSDELTASLEVVVELAGTSKPAADLIRSLLKKSSAANVSQPAPAPTTDGLGE